MQSDEIHALYFPLSANDINFLFFSCEPEEKERTGFDMYSLPHQGSLQYAGFAGVFQEVN